MFSEVELIRDVELTKGSRLIRQKHIIYAILVGLLHEKASKDHGYFLSVTSLESIKKQEILDETKEILLRVVFKCRTFMPVTGEVLEGVVYGVFRLGVLLRCGPMEHVFLSIRKMPNYSYLPGEHPVFLNTNNNRFRKIGVAVVVRFVVLDVRWTGERGDTEKEFKMLASIDGDESLGPVTIHEDDGILS